MRKKSVAKIVEEVVSSFPCIEKALEYDVISLTRLARKIERDVSLKYGSKVSLSSIVMALERMKDNKVFPSKLNYKIEEISSLSSIGLLVYAKSRELDKELSSIYKKFMPDNFINVIEGNYDITLISNESLLKKIKNLIGKPKKELYGLSMITISFPEEMLNAHGFIAYILKELAFEGINIVEILSSHRELSLLLDKKDFIKAYTAIESLFSS